MGVGERVIESVVVVMEVGKLTAVSVDERLEEPGNLEVEPITVEGFVQVDVSETARVVGQ